MDCCIEQSKVTEKDQMTLNPGQKHRKYEFMQDNEIIYEHFLGQSEHLFFFFITYLKMYFVLKVKN